MALSRALLYVFTFFYAAIAIYLLAFFLSPEFKNFIIEIRGLLVNLTEGTNYYWAVFIAFIVCLVGSASIGFPIPFPFILFTLSNSVLIRYGNQGLLLEEILVNGGYWLEILGFVIFGGLGSALGELSGYIIGYSSKTIFKDSDSEVFKNLNGFSKLFLENRKSTPVYIFLFALTPLPDDILFLPLGMLKYPWWKAIIPAWIGKNFTILFYCIWPLLFSLGLLGIGAELNAELDVVVEGIMILITLTIMMFIFGFDWQRYLEDRRTKKENKY